MATISVVLDPPLPTDNVSTFDSKAFAFIGSLPTFVTQTNALRAEVVDKNTETIAARDTTVATKDVVVAKFLGAFASDSAANAAFPARVVGSMYWNTTSNLLRAHTGSGVWVVAATTSSATGVTLESHKAIAYGDNHVAHSIEYANASARTGASLATVDIGRIARQIDTGAFWILKNNIGPVWQEMSVPDLSAYAIDAPTVPTTLNSGAANFTISKTNKLFTLTTSNTSAVALSVLGAVNGYYYDFVFELIVSASYVPASFAITGFSREVGSVAPILASNKRYVFYGYTTNGGSVGSLFYLGEFAL